MYIDNGDIHRTAPAPPPAGVGVVPHALPLAASDAAPSAPPAAISVRGLGKRFRRTPPFDSLRDLLAASLRPVWRRSDRNRAALAAASFWALRDVSFDVAPGEAFGIIGPNGAGKSTLLKLLAGILRPNEGEVHTQGRISALIELGAAFHGDLSGRENVYLTASILGLSRRETQRRFGRIVEFADIGEYLDSPVKHYSSGMQARLGFAIAAHVDADILLVDEVLSVGDAAFRARCLKHMNAALARGAAVVFVSHDLASVAGFCRRALLLVAGQVDSLGPAAAVVGRYHDATARLMILPSADDRPAARVVSLCLTDHAGRARNAAAPGERLRLELEIEYGTALACPSYGFYLMSATDRSTLFETSSTRLGVMAEPVRPGDRQTVRYDFRVNVEPGEYTIGYHVRDRDAHGYLLEEADAMRLVVHGTPQSTAPIHLAPRLTISHLADDDGRTLVERSA